MDCDGDETERGWALMVAYHTPVSEAGRNRSETHWRCLQIALSTWYLTASGSRSELERPGDDNSLMRGPELIIEQGLHEIL